MRPWNEFCVRHRRPFLPVVLQDLIGYIGPIVVPGETACFECLRARQNSNLINPETQRAAEARAFDGQAIAAAHPAMSASLGAIAGFELTSVSRRLDAAEGGRDAHRDQHLGGRDDFAPSPESAAMPGL